MKYLYDIEHGCQSCFLKICDCVHSKYDCPCSDIGCCENPDTYTPEHKCVEEVCESCFATACKNCNAVCYCDL